MSKNLRRTIRCFLAASVMTWYSVTHALTTKEAQLAAMDAILAELDVHYGMAGFKESMFGVTTNYLRRKYGKLIEQAKTLEELKGFAPAKSRSILPSQEFRQLMIGMIAELRDGHVSLHRLSHEAWGVGLVTAMIDGRLVVTGKNNDLMVANAAATEINVGDEIVAIDGTPVLKLAESEMLYSQYATYESRLMNALESLLLRFHSTRRPVNEGDPVTLNLKRGQFTYTAHLTWLNLKKYLNTRSRYPQYFDSSRAKAWSEEIPVPYGLGGTVSSYFKRGLVKKNLPPGSVLNIGALYNSELIEARGEGKTALSTGASASNGSGSGSTKGPIQPVKRLQAYLIHHGGKTLGVLRVPSYSSPTMINEIRWLNEIILRMQNSADMLILDVLSNTGGSVFYGTRLLSMLAGENSLYSIQANTRLTETMLYLWADSDEPKDYESGRRLNYGEDRVAQLVLEDWERRFAAGERWTGMRPYFANVTTRDGAGVIVPNGTNVFKKPILVLNDNRSASGGDFVPAVLQSNGRGLVMGETSKGLGGPVYRSIDSMPGSEMGFRCTIAYCERADGQPIENIGVLPDLPRAITIDDVVGVNDFSSYASDVLEVALALAKGETAKMVQASHLGRMRKRQANEDRANRLESAQNSIYTLTSSLQFKETDKDLAKLNPTLVNQIIALGVKLAEDGKDLSPDDWTHLTLPLPKSLRTSDPILNSLWKKDETIERLEQMLKLEPLRSANQQLGAWQTQEETISAGRGTRRSELIPPEVNHRARIYSIAYAYLTALKAIPGPIRVANSCLRLLE